MNPSSHLLDSHAQPIALRPMEIANARVDQPHVPEQGSERFTAFHLLREDWSGILPIGSQFAFLCCRHQFATERADDPDNLIAICPMCEVEREQQAGRLRYRILHGRLTGYAVEK